jgi:hypothetical protein
MSAVELLSKLFISLGGAIVYAVVAVLLGSPAFLGQPDLIMIDLDTELSEEKLRDAVFSAGQGGKHKLPRSYSRRPMAELKLEVGQERKISIESPTPKLIGYAVRSPVGTKDERCLDGCVEIGSGGASLKGDAQEILALPGENGRLGVSARKLESHPLELVLYRDNPRASVTYVKN